MMFSANSLRKCGTASGIPSTLQPVAFTNRFAFSHAIVKITENACLSCHAEIVQAMGAPARHGGSADLSCIRCHSSVGHTALAPMSARNQ
jgi:hypothetical protein